MLKRWLALLAAVMLLPCLTLAEGGALMVSTRWEADEAALQTLLVRLETDGESASQLSEIGAELMQRLTTHILLQPNGAQATIRLRDREIISGSFVCEDGGVYLRSSVIPGIALFVPDVNMNPLGLTGEELEQLGLDILTGATDAAKAWFDGLKQRQVSPIVGDAYGEAANAYACSADAEQIAGLLSSLWQAYVSALPSELRESMTEPPQIAIPESMRATITVARREDMEPVGFDVTISMDQQQVFTCSMSLKDMRLVIGAMLDHSFCYADVAVSESAAADGQEGPRCDIALYDGRGVSYAEAKLDPERRLMDIRCSSHWDDDPDGICTEETLILLPGTEQAAIRCTTDIKRSKAISAYEAGDTVIRVSEGGAIAEEDMQRIDEALSKGRSTLMTRLLMNLPPKVVKLLSE